MSEVWKSIRDFPGYEVSNHGRVGSFKKRNGKPGNWIIADTLQRILSPALTRGYRAINLCHDGTSSFRRIGGLVLEAFVGVRPKGMEVCHADCNKQNDHLDNLRYDTRAANQADGYGDHVEGRLTNQQARKVRLLASQGVKDKELAENFDVSIDTISACRTGYRYKAAGGALTSLRRKLTDADVLAMRIKNAQSKPELKQLAKEYEVTPSSISLILRGLRHQSAGGPITPNRYTHAPKTTEHIQHAERSQDDKASQFSPHSRQPT